MTKLSSYYLPGLYVEDFSVEVPLDWRGHEPAEVAVNGLPAGERTHVFYRTVCSPENKGRDLPLLVFLQGGPGGQGPRLLSPSSDGWVAEAIKHYRVVLPDQRGTGRSGHVSRHAMAERGGAREQAEFLKRFLARSIVRDFEYLRLTELGGRKWTTLGQSYGGFLTLCYLSFYPEGVAASFTCGGIPHVPASAAEVYAHTFGRMAAKTRAYYERYPEDAERLAAIADACATGDVRLPDGSPLSPRRLQTLGSGLGMKPAPERLHALLDTAFEVGDGSLAGNKVQLTDAFLMSALSNLTTAGNPLYWVLQEFIYADGTLDAPIRWAAEQEYAKRPEFSASARPLMLTGEAAFPFMLEDDPLLAPFKPAVDLLMEDTEFDQVYDEAQLAANTVPLQAAVYFDDMYVDSGLQLDTLSHMGASHAWVTNEFEHDGLHGSEVFAHLFAEAQKRGDLEASLTA
jgi:pimeloyl-ACP methyl ester carboxylesterase